MKTSKNESIGMQRKAFSEKIGLTERQVLRFCELNVFNPERPSDAPNNRRYFTESDLKIAELIHILSKLGFNPPAIKEIFEEFNHDTDSILDYAIRDMKRRIAHYQNLVTAAEMAQSLGTSLFSFSDMSDVDIDEFAKTVRRTDSYKKSRSFLRKSSKQDRERIAQQLQSLTEDFSALNQKADDNFDSKGFLASVEPLVEEYSSIYTQIADADCNLLILSLGGIFAFGDGVLSLEADEIGGEGTAEFMGVCFILVWISRMSRLVFPLVDLLIRSKDDSTRFDAIASELFSLFDPESLSVQIPNTVQKTDSPIDSRIALFDLVFDFANEFRNDPELLSALEIEAASLPSKEQFDYALDLLNTHAQKHPERKEV